METTGASAQRTALLAGTLCYLFWGFNALAFQAMGKTGAGSWEILAHRSVWGALTALIFVLASRQTGQVMAVFRNPRLLGALVLCSALIGVNWSLYVWGVNSGRVIESSLGYYLTPLLNMAAGVVIFRERFDRFGLAAIVLAGIGVVIQGLALGHMPWIAIILALTFGGYGVVRKQIAAEAQTGLFVECLFLTVPGLAWIFWASTHGQSHFLATPAATFWLMSAGPVTALPLMLFAWAARRMPLSAMGFLQFIGPTIGFVIGLAQGELFTPLRALSFVFIWGGAGVYVTGVWLALRRKPALQA